MRFSKSPVADFYMPCERNASVIAERRKWIGRDPLVHVAMMEPGVALLDETMELASSLATIPEIWFRLEDSLPTSGGILFGIKLVILPMRGIKSDPEACQGMVRALRTMPEPMATYKGIAAARNRLLELMEDD